MEIFLCFQMERKCLVSQCCCGCSLATGSTIIGAMYLVSIKEKCLKKYFVSISLIRKILLKSNPNQIVFTMHQLIWNQTDIRLLFQINRKMVDTV